MPPRTLVLLATLLAAASAQVSQPSIKTVSGSIELAVPLDGSVTTRVEGGEACHLDTTCDLIERVQAEIDATQTLLDATRTLQAAALACGTSTAPGVWDPVTSACRVGFALADVDECSSTESPCSGRTICVNTPGSFICAPDLNECLTNNGGCNAHAACDDSALGEAAVCTCATGHFGDGLACTLCPAGTAKADAGNGDDEEVCVPCAANRTSTAFRATCECAPGYSGAACQACPRNTFKAAAGAASCTACARNATIDARFGVHSTTHVSGATSSADCLSLDWSMSGTLVDIGTILRNKPPTHFELAATYNKEWQYPLVPAGIGTSSARVSSSRWYPQQDTLNGQRWGSVMWMKGYGGDSTHEWYHHYYRLDGDGTTAEVTGNGIQTSGRTIFSRPLVVPWEHLGALPDVLPKSSGGPAMADFFARYPVEEYQMGWKIPGVGIIQEVFWNEWGSGERLTGYPMYVINDNHYGDVRNTFYGTSTVTLGMSGHLNNTQWTHSFMRYPEGRLDGLDSVADIQIYIRKNPTVWVRAGTLGGYAAAVGRFPDATHKLGMKMPGRGMQTIFKNGWNRGARVTLFPHYPAGDSVATLKFVATVLSNGVNSVSPIWMRTYYAQNVNGGYGDSVLGGPAVFASTTPLFAKTRLFRWQRQGSLASLNWNTVRNSFPGANFNKGMTYNGNIQTATDTSWNWGERLALSPSFPLYDDYNNFQFGTAIFIRGCVGCQYGTSSQRWSQVVSQNARWTHAYYRTPNTYIGGNGNPNPPVYVQLSGEPGYVLDGFGMVATA